MQDPFMILFMCARLPLLDIIDQFMKFAQREDVYVCYFLDGIPKYKSKIYEFYIDEGIAFSNSKFYDFAQLLACNHEHINLTYPHDEQCKTRTSLLGGECSNLSNL